MEDPHSDTPVDSDGSRRSRDKTSNARRTLALLASSLSVAGSLQALVKLGYVLSNRFEYLGHPEDIKNVIRCRHLAVVLISGNNAAKADLLYELSHSYLCRFNSYGDCTDIDKAIRCQSQAVLLLPVDHPNMASWLNDLGIAYRHRFELRGSSSDIDKAIECQSRSVLYTPDGHSDKSHHLASLGNSYQCRFQHLGEIEDVDAAINFQHKAVQLLPEDHVDMAGQLNNLGISYSYRFQRLGQAADVDKAIECQSQAALLTPEGHADKPGFLSNLGNSYQSRFQSFGEISDADKAIECQTQAVLLTPDGHADKLGLLNNLGNSYACRFQRLYNIADVDKGIECQSEAVLLTPDGSPYKPNWLLNLGSSYLCRFEHFNHVEDVDKAIHYQGQAVRLTPENHTDKPRGLNDLGNSYRRRFQRFGKRADIQTAITWFQKAAQISTGSPRARFSAARDWARYSRLLRDSPLLAYRRAMELVPDLVWLGASVDQRFSLVVDIGNIAMEAASCAISVNSYNDALEWLEQGRSVVWNQLLQLRTPFGELASVDHELAKKLEEVAHELEQAGSRSAPASWSIHTGHDLEKHAQRHRRLAAEWERLLNNARQIPGFDGFMRPRKAGALMNAAKNGPIVIINVHRSRCDALIIRSHRGPIAHVPLEKFPFQRAIEANALLGAAIQLGGTRGLVLKPSKSGSKTEEMFKEVLATLWFEVVKPVLDFLGYTSKQPIDELPHITWCTTGQLSFLPLHAAGCYDGLQPNTPDLVVSSYTPTLSAALSPPPQVPGSGSLLAVGQAYTKGLNDLPNTVHELTAIKEHAKDISYAQLDGDRATVDAVLQAMNEHSWVHLACHAIQNPSKPAHSAFHLNDGALTLETITRHALKNKGLAFLSACQTASGDSKLPDEAIHLAAGMLMAGYPSVIATMWSIDDVDGPEVAREVYAELLKDGKMDYGGAARALHKAVIGLREQLVGSNSFRRWVPFIHIGA